MGPIGWLFLTKEFAMFAGHVGAALAIGRVERRINVSAFIFAALLLDFVLWLFVLLGWESVIVPAHFASTHQAEFVFPYSHGLLASVVWSALAGVATFAGLRHLRQARLRAAALVAAAVFSHWLLDALVHVAELPLANAASLKVGLGLWQHMPIALIAEAGILFGGLCLFVPDADLSPARKICLTVLCLLILIFTVLGMTVAPAPPSTAAMATSSLVTIVVVCVLAFWLARHRHRSRA
jgi:hypothetical protein